MQAQIMQEQEQSSQKQQTQETNEAFQPLQSVMASWPFEREDKPVVEFTQSELQSLRSFLKHSIRNDEAFVKAINFDINRHWERAIPGAAESGEYCSGQYHFEQYSFLRTCKKKIKQEIKVKAELQRKIRLMLTQSV